ncbi:MAG TPA: flavodoxin domain-containing protein [Desulfosporosinus sp.]|nr:flavodoxin domain-containing protein [Desulfosporosinus sp.]
MKTMIIYSTTYEYTKDCAERLKEYLAGEVIVVNATTDVIPQLDDIDNVLIGGSIYMGKIQKNMKEFCASNVALLKDKRLGLFLCCGLPEKFEQAMADAFPQELLKNALAKECFGGELRTKRMNLVHKMIAKLMIKAAVKEGKELIKQMPENIGKMAATFNR